MTRDEKIAEAHRLRGEGKSYEEIGSALGVTGSCVTKWLNPERTREWVRAENARRGPAKRAWEAAPEQRGRCEVCGATLGVNSRRNRNRYCWAHTVLFRRLRQSARRRIIEQMNLRGEPHAVIAARLGISAAGLSEELSRMRRDGWVLPYRRAGWARRAGA